MKSSWRRSNRSDLSRDQFLCITFRRSSVLIACFFIGICDVEWMTCWHLRDAAFSMLPSIRTVAAAAAAAAANCLHRSDRRCVWSNNKFCVRTMTCVEYYATSGIRFSDCRAAQIADIRQRDGRTGASDTDAATFTIPTPVICRLIRTCKPVMITVCAGIQSWQSIMTEWNRLRDVS